MRSLCATCQNVRVIVSGKGSRFFLCQKSQHDERYAKYPPQPVVRCAGYQAAEIKSAPMHSPAAGDGDTQGDQSNAEHGEQKARRRFTN
jgi:hypothetical protein